MAPSGVVSFRITLRSVRRWASETMAGFGQEEVDHRGAEAHQDQRRAELGDHQVLRHVEREELNGERVHRREQRDGPERYAAVEGALLEAS